MEDVVCREDLKVCIGQLFYSENSYYLLFGSAVSSGDFSIILESNEFNNYCIIPKAEDSDITRLSDVNYVCRRKK